MRRFPSWWLIPSMALAAACSKPADKAAEAPPADTAAAAAPAAGPQAIVTVIYNQPKSPAAFEKYYAEKHLPLVTSLQPEIGFTKAELSKFTSTLDDWAAGLDLAATLVTDERVLPLVDSPARPFRDRLALIEKLLAGRVPEGVIKLAGLLVQRGRAERLRAVAAEYHRLLDLERVTPERAGLDPARAERVAEPVGLQERGVDLVRERPHALERLLDLPLELLQVTACRRRIAVEELQRELDGDGRRDEVLLHAVVERPLDPPALAVELVEHRRITDGRGLRRQVPRRLSVEQEAEPRREGRYPGRRIGRLPP